MGLRPCPGRHMPCHACNRLRPSHSRPPALRLQPIGQRQRTDGGGAHAPPLRRRPGTCARQSRPRGASLTPAHTRAPTHGGARAPTAGYHLCLHTPGGSLLPFEGALWGRGPPAVPPGPSMGACPLPLSGAALCLRTGLRKDPPTCLGGATAVVWWLLLFD